MQCSEVVIGDKTVPFVVSGAFFSISRIEESSSEKFFSVTVFTMKCFIFRSVLGIVGVTDMKETAADHVGYTIEAIDAFAKISAMTQKQFIQNCNEALSFRKTYTEDLYFKLLEYKSLFAPNTKNCNPELDAKRSREQKGRYGRL